MEIKIFCAKDWVDYELLDTGGGEKLEKFGPYTFVRPYEEAVWKKTLSGKEWTKADGKFWSSKTGAVKGWKMKNKISPRWELSYKGIRFLVSPTPFRHLGFFPEQASHWDFIESKIKEAKKETQRPVKFLNLFGYTGVASLFALRAGAEVTHIDASKQTIEWAKENQKVSGLDNMPIRIIYLYYDTFYSAFQMAVLESGISRLLDFSSRQSSPDTTFPLSPDIASSKA